MAVRHEAVAESVPENAKNMLLVLATTGVLTPEWRDASGRSLWELTWGKVHSISSGLNPGMLQTSLTPATRAAHADDPAAAEPATRTFTTLSEAEAIAARACSTIAAAE